ncbi:unnamed protein product [Mycena citricolor]|uniref:AB hydrolase-1 domain-containing protein n=1 Tax=Mycena citricolor TaxID=2018698 RepID=A0AAD2HJL7_9AGAR|nr:unnamed protein product [Mycena citricolor]
MDPSFHITKHLFDARPRYQYRLTASCYRFPLANQSGSEDDSSGLTLVLTHGSGFHKEHFEPTIDELLRLVTNQAESQSVSIREIWALDHPSHGQAALLNEALFHRQGGTDDGARKYAQALYAFLTLPNPGVGVDFSQRNVVLVGHSMGAMAITPRITPICAILVELVAGDPAMMKEVTDQLAQGSHTRRDRWSSRASASRFMKKRKMWEKWDPRILDLYLAYGLRPLPTLKYPSIASGVTLTCTIEQEESISRDLSGIIYIWNSIQTVTTRHPLHLIYGTKNDILSLESKDSFIAQAGGSEKFESIHSIPGAAHLIVQTHPTALAERIFDILRSRSLQGQFARAARM